MSRQRDTDKAIRNLMRFVDRPEWAEKKAAAFDAHLAPICERLDTSQEALVQELAEHGYGGMLFGILFEDFISRDPAPGDQNPVDEYLSRRGWRESAADRDYLQQLRDSVLSLYEVVEVARGRHCDVRDLVRGGESVRVHECMGTQNLVRWDRIAARVLKSKGKYIFSGGILPFPQEAAQRLLRVLSDSRQELPQALVRVVRKHTAPSALDRLLLKDACHAFTQIWLVHALELLRAPLPEMANRDGEALLCTETHFPVDEKNRRAVTERLDAATQWERDPEGEPAWTWLPEGQGALGVPEQAPSLQSLAGGERPASGTLELKPKALLFATNSLERMERGKKLLMALLCDLVGPPLTKVETPEQLMAEQKPVGQPAADLIDPEVAAAIMRDYLDQHYRRCLDEPIPVLGGETPRHCIGSEQGREQVIEWLKYLENEELHRAAQAGAMPYDFGWMWEELKLERPR